jgi:hypothetical protein
MRVSGRVTVVGRVNVKMISARMSATSNVVKHTMTEHQS